MFENRGQWYTPLEVGQARFLENVPPPKPRQPRKKKATAVTAATAVTVVTASVAPSVTDLSREASERMVAFLEGPAPGPAPELVGTNGSIEVGGLTVTFHRTLRLPEDGKTHALPPSLGAFPLLRVDDYKEKVPEAWREHGGIFLPLYQREALWLGFRQADKPRALKVAAGKVNAVSGAPWSETLEARSEPDYMVAPPQPWLDGFNVGKGVIRQFVAMPLGMRYTVEAQVTGEEKVGGLQLIVFAPKPGGKADIEMIIRTTGGYKDCSEYMLSESTSMDSMGSQRRLMRSAEMGLAEGGRMKQKIYEDPYGVEAWEAAGERCFVHIVNSELWKEITGEDAPATPVSAHSYAAHGYPWFDLYDEHVPAIDGSSVLAGVKTVSEKDAAHGFEGQQDDTPIDEKNIKKYGVDAQLPINEVRDGKW